ncbi:hypothetical protein [Sulfurovum mangrovi]|uniref:hypothetical protein n=1 Tax=Sulfurovum mangrovi TaxID=2893889 RepID=UPI001E6573EE|nr:hypothetical protein [Sulfurovum mangrovi]UFH59922.1 hypothetical protein LN246_03520 [Sulfurovum mangrovi]
MKRTKNLLLIGILFSLPLFFTGCEEKSSETAATLPVENSTEIVGGQDSYIKKSLTQSSTEEKMLNDQKSAASDHFIFQKSDGTKFTLMLQDGKLLPDPQSKPILLINLFDINERASIAQISYLNKLQDKYANRLTVLGIPTNQSMDEATLKAFINQQQVDYFISYENRDQRLIGLFSERLSSDGITTPTTLLYHNGESGRIYEGAVPIEMITHDILMINKE